MNTSKSTTPDDITIEPRRPAFDFSEVPRYWLHDPFATHFMNALSVFVPYSERTVLEIIRKYANHISDPRLLREMDALFKQEGLHALLHIRCNGLLGGCGYSAFHVFEVIQRSFVKLVRKISPAMWELPIPAAFEFFTSEISREFAGNRAAWVGDELNEAVDFTSWHALEELEHQAVCYDVFKALNNPSWILTAILISCWIPATVVSIYGVQLYLLFKDRVLLKPRNWVPYLKFIGTSLPMLTRGTFKYLSGSYRPWTPADQKLYWIHKERMASFLEKRVAA